MSTFAEFSRVHDIHGFKPEWGVVLGSGLGSLVNRVTESVAIPFSQPGLPDSRVPGHAGRFVCGMLGGKRVLIAQGRVHLYEGRFGSEVTSTIRFMAEAGVKKLILTNAAGTLNPDFKPGGWMMISDHLNLTGASPLVGLSGGPHFVDMTALYSPALRSFFSRVAEERGFALHEGVYAGMLGPQYETPAEIRMLRVCGADAVGMSTVLEAIQGRAVGLEVAGFSCLANWASGLNPEPLSHHDVLTRVSCSADAFSAFLEEALSKAE